MKRSDDAHTTKARLKVKWTRRNGRGVYANCAIAKGEVIEIAPVIVLSRREARVVDALPLASHMYQWGPDGKQSAFVMGFASFYNHSYSPNARYSAREKSKGVVFRAIKDIALGEEITHNYNGDPKNQTPIKFTKHSWWWPEQKGKHK